MNEIVACTWRQPRTQGARRCNQKFELDHEDQKTFEVFGDMVSYECPTHELADQIIYNLAIINCLELGIKIKRYQSGAYNGLDAINAIFYRSLKNKKFKKILKEINHYAPILARRQIQRQMEDGQD